jgi:hypothetical protein
MTASSHLSQQSQNIQPESPLNVLFVVDICQVEETFRRRIVWAPTEEIAREYALANKHVEHEIDSHVLDIREKAVEASRRFDEHRFTEPLRISEAKKPEASNQTTCTLADRLQPGGCDACGG